VATSTGAWAGVSSFLGVATFLGDAQEVASTQRLTLKKRASHQETNALLVLLMGKR
jgi:hypothetical protein